MNISPAHSWRAIKKCLKETKKLPRASYPLGNTSQFIKPVLHKITKRIKDITFTVHSFKDFPLDIYYP
jgi:porphobilinogen deaminase